MMLVRRALPRAITFGDAYPDLRGLTMTGWDLDRQFLAGLDRPAWDEVVESFRVDLPDPVIEDAARRLPAPYYELVGEDLAEALKARRDALPEFVDRYYELITPQVEIQATDEDEYVSAEHLPSGDLLVRIRREGDADEAPEPPWFERTFHHEETREVRIYLRGGRDRAEISGAEGRIAVRIDGGGGGDAFTNASQAGASSTYFYDDRGNNEFVEGKGATVDERPYARPTTSLVWSRYAFDWGMEPSTRPIVWADPDLGVFGRVIHSRKYYGFRKDPFATRHYFDVGLASRGFKPFVSYVGTFRHVRPDIDARLAFEYSGFEVTRFKGFGNDFRLDKALLVLQGGAAALRPGAGPGVSTGDRGRGCDGGRHDAAALGTHRQPRTRHRVVQHAHGVEPRLLHRRPGRTPVRHGHLRPDRSARRNRVRQP